MNLNKLAKIFTVFSAAIFLTACGDESENTKSPSFKETSDIHVITREDGSGTRGAFVELAEVIDENGDDYTTNTATVQNSTSGVIQGISNDIHAIGYISLGSLDDSVQALAVDGVVASPETVATGEYKVARNFNVVFGENLSDEVKDFYTFMFSTQAQEIVVEKGYTAAKTDTETYEPKSLSGEISIVGSTSVEPLMQALTEAYQTLNPEIIIDITAPGSGAGITAVADKTADIGMVSRELDEQEITQVAEVEAIAIDGIAIIVHKDSPIEELTLEQIQKIYLGETIKWEEIEK